MIRSRSSKHIEGQTDLITAIANGVVTVRPTRSKKRDLIWLKHGFWSSRHKLVAWVVAMLDRSVAGNANIIVFAHLACDELLTRQVCNRELVTNAIEKPNIERER